VFVEGKLTEEDYLVFWHREHRRHVNVQIHDTRGAPLTLVRAAVEAKKQERRQENRRQGRAHDEIWCVFDVDEHPSIPEARNLARAHGIFLAVSNPCIELWFILHFQDQTAYIDRHNAQRVSRDLLSCDKALSPAALEALHQRNDDARARAIYLDAKHEGDGSPDGANPSSGMWTIVDSIRSGNTV
jgi:hypothetical protein